MDKWVLASKTNLVALAGVILCVADELSPFENQIKALLGPHWAPTIGLVFSIAVVLARNIKSNTTIHKEGA